MTVYKNCRVCEKLLPHTLKYFENSKHYASNISSRCISCKKKYEREWYRKKREKNPLPKNKYTDFKTEKGRFTKGNPGGPGEPFLFKNTEELLAELRDILQMILDDPKMFTWKRIAEEKSYAICTLQRYVKKYTDPYSDDFSPEANEIAIKINDIFRLRMEDAALHFKIQPVFTMFLLKCNYKYQDTQRIENVNITQETLTHESQELLDRLAERKALVAPEDD